MSSLHPGDGRARVLLAAPLLLILTSPALALDPPRLDRPVDYLDRLLGRPYTTGTKLGSTGRSLWATHPDGWGFANDVHYVQLDWLEGFRLAIALDGLPVEPGPAWAHASHVETWALPPGDVALNPESEGRPSARGPEGEAWAVVDGDRRALELWRGSPDRSGETWLEVELPRPHRLGSVLLTLVENPARALALPRTIRLERGGPGGFTPIEPIGPAPPRPSAGANLLAFKPVWTSRIRVVFTATTAVGVAEIEAYEDRQAPLELIERKFIDPEDRLVSVLEARNLGRSPARLTVAATSGLAPSLDGAALTGSRMLHTVPVSLRLELQGAVSGAGQLVREVFLAPGAAVRVAAVMAFSRSPAEAQASVAAGLALPDPAAAQVERFGRWFLDRVPQLDVPDPWIEKAYHFRFEVARRTMTDPRFGPLRHPTFEEGRWAAPWFTRPITYGAPHQLAEARWFRDPALARGHALTFVENARADGAFVSVPLEGPRSEYTDWIASGILDVFLATGDTDLLGRSLAAMRANLEYVRSRDGDGDALPLVADHFETGMEWQPAFFYFNGYATDVATPLERVDYASALFANARATAAAARALCDLEGEREALDLAERVRQAVEAKMWDEGERFYLSLREDDEKARVREVVGFYPLAFGLADPAHDDVVAALFDPADFSTPWPPASSSLTCPATSQDGWPIGPGGSQAMWNGPTWPHAVSLVAQAVGRALRRSGERFATRTQLFALLDSYTHAHYWGAWDQRDFAEPMVGEYYHGTTGIWRTGERDYFHSTFADLVIRLLVGLEPALEPVVRLDPLLPPGTWQRFLLERLPYRGHEVTVLWDEPGGEDAYRDGREGLELWIDGTLAASRPDLGRLEAALPGGRLFAVKDPGTGGVRFATETSPPWSLYRSPGRDLAPAEPLPGSPFAAPAALDPAPPAAAATYYRSGACGPGR